ncbi:MAG: hypothetical protein KGN36_12045 [Acidobacteriota bacterium]|nr:hypothetical protein [Acidobacteriota bacterium]
MLIPKCPACLAAWVLLGTGWGVSAAMAGRLRELAIALCLAPAVLWAARALLRRSQFSFASAFWAARLHGAVVRRR